MKPEPRVGRIITIARLACGALPDDRCAGEIPRRAATVASGR